MESVPAVFASTSESTNYARLCRLLVDVGCTVLRDIFDRKNPPANLLNVLSCPYVHFILKPLKTVLNSMLWRELSHGVASNVSSAHFNATVLMVLLRNICDLKPPVSTDSWDELPPESDRSTEANIVRINCYRDEVYAYNSEASVDDSAFIELWKKISRAVLVLGYETSDGAFYENVISELATAKDMDPAAEAHFIKLLSDWKKDDDSLKEMPEELKGMLIDLVTDNVWKKISWGAHGAIRLRYVLVMFIKFNLILVGN